MMEKVKDEVRKCGKRRKHKDKGEKVRKMGKEEKQEGRKEKGKNEEREGRDRTEGWKRWRTR